MLGRGWHREGDEPVQPVVAGRKRDPSTFSKGIDQSAEHPADPMDPRIELTPIEDPAVTARRERTALPIRTRHPSLPPTRDWRLATPD